MNIIPYIKKSDRLKFEECINELSDMIEEWGEFNYVVSKLIKNISKKRSMSYDFINSVMGVLSCIQAEFYRTVAVPHENRKGEENGDI